MEQQVLNFLVLGAFYCLKITEDTKDFMFIWVVSIDIYHRLVK